jgi:Flp pilus assembly protein TadG
MLRRFFLGVSGGSVSVEMAVVMPLFATVMLGILQSGTLQAGRMSFERGLHDALTVAAAADRGGVSRGNANLAISDAFSLVASNPAAADYGLVVRRITVVAGAATEVWSTSSGSLSPGSVPGVVGGVAPMPSGTTLAEGEDLYVAGGCRRFAWSFLPSSSTVCGVRYMLRSQPPGY